MQKASVVTQILDLPLVKDRDIFFHMVESRMLRRP